MGKQDMLHAHNEILFSLKKKKKNDFLIHDTTQMNSEGIMLSKISWTQKDKYCMIPLIRGI